VGLQYTTLTCHSRSGILFLAVSSFTVVLDSVGASQATCEYRNHPAAKQGYYKCVVTLTGIHRTPIVVWRQSRMTCWFRMAVHPVWLRDLCIDNVAVCDESKISQGATIRSEFACCQHAMLCQCVASCSRLRCKVSVQLDIAWAAIEVQ
jgi:hypothetical protein